MPGGKSGKTDAIAHAVGKEQRVTPCEPSISQAFLFPKGFRNLEVGQAQRRPSSRNPVGSPGPRRRGRMCNRCNTAEMFVRLHRPAHLSEAEEGGGIRTRVGNSDREFPVEMEPSRP